MNDINIYLGGQWGGSLIERMSLRPYLIVSVSSASLRVSNICKAKNMPLLVQNEERVHKMCSFNSELILYCLIGKGGEGSLIEE